jgi:hypothetical protein
MALEPVVVSSSTRKIPLIGQRQKLGVIPHNSPSLSVNTVLKSLRPVVEVVEAGLEVVEITERGVGEQCRDDKRSHASRSKSHDRRVGLFDQSQPRLLACNHHHRQGRRTTTSGQCQTPHGVLLLCCLTFLIAVQASCMGYYSCMSSTA